MRLLRRSVTCGQRYKAGAAAAALAFAGMVGMPLTASASQQPASVDTCAAGNVHANQSAYLHRAALAAGAGQRACAAGTTANHVTSVQDGECFDIVGRNITNNNTLLQGWTYFQNCTGTVACSARAELQEDSPTHPGNWVTIKEGPLEFGNCNTSASHSVVSIACSPNKGVNFFTYRTLGIVTIHWADAPVSTFDDTSDSITASTSC